MIDLKGAPFFLDSEGIAWVHDTLQKMTIEKKIGQLFCPLGLSGRKKDLRYLTQEIGIGGIMFRPAKGEKAQEIHRFLQCNSEIPLLIGGNLEAGGSGAATDGTAFGLPLQTAATDDMTLAKALGTVSCAEGAAVGLNWAFAPIVDIDCNFRNPITNLRTFGSDPARVLAMAKAYLAAAAEQGVATAIKHFPGDGVDERDQHLLTSVNSLSCEAWDDSYGKIYRALIQAGAKSVMVGHIAQPAWQKRLSGNADLRETIPATLSKELMTGLLRERLGFNGLIVTDASPMAGFRAAMKREDAVPLSIAAGADLFLFVRDMATDFGYMLQGCQSGVLSTERLDTAVTRILALKASLGLHKKAKEQIVPDKKALTILGCEAHQALAKQCAEKSITLVKDTQQLLPITPQKYKRVYLNVLENNLEKNSLLNAKLVKALEQEGFTVTLRDRGAVAGVSLLLSSEKSSLRQKAKIVWRARHSVGELLGGASELSDKYDLVIYAANFETASENTVIRLNWKGFMGIGNDVPWFVREIPTLFVSLANPYHLLDVPMVKTYINAYSASDVTLAALMEKLTGRSAFTGVSPVDASCGREDALY